MKHLGCSPSAQVEQNVPLECNINSDFTLAATTTEYIDQRGERNIPKRYLKEADWCEDRPLGTGYYITCLDNPSILIPIDFNFKHLQWGAPIPRRTDLWLKDLHLRDMDSVFLMKKEPRTEAVGDP